MGAQQSQMVNEDDDRSGSSKRDYSPFSHLADGDDSDRDDNHADIDSSQREKPVFSSQVPPSARRGRELGKMSSSSKSKKRRSRRSPDASQEFPPHSSQDFEPPFVKHESHMVQEGEDGDEDQDTVAQIKGDPGDDDEPAPVIEDKEFGEEIMQKAKRERRERKELKKARKAEKMRLSQLKGDPDAMDETDSHDASQLNGVSPETHRTNGFVAVNHEVPASPEVVEASKPSKRRKRLPSARSVAAEDSIQSNENGEVSSLALPASSANGTVVPTSSPLKRKGRDSSSKKQRKKQKQQVEDVEEEKEDTAGMSVPFADAAQDIYAERYNESPSSPSAARLQRRSQSRADSPEPDQSDTEMAQLVQHDQVSQSAEDEIVRHTMDVDDDNDVDLPVNNHSAERDASEEASGNEIENHLGSDDLGVAEPMEVDHEASGDDINGNAVPTPAFGSSRGSAKRQYGSKASTGRKRRVKAPFNDAEHSEENNRQAFEHLPAASPSATSAKKGHRKDDNADVGPSSAAKSKGSTKPGGSKALRKVQDPSKEEENTGPFTEEELSKIDTALKHWQEDHDLTDHARNELIHMNPQNPKAKAAYSMELWDAVQGVVPGRKRQKIISQCRRKYHNFSARGAWTQEQHDELVRLYNQYGNKYADIGREMNRYAEDVRDRIRNYVVCGDAWTRAPWTMEEQLTLGEIIKKSLKVIRGSESFKALDNRKKEEDLIDWQAVSESMGRTRSRLQCQMKWKKMKASMDDEEEPNDVSRKEPIEQIIQRAREEVVKVPAQDLSRIAKRVKDTKATKHNRIPWSRVRAGGVATKYSRPVLILAWCRMRLLVPEWEALTPVDIAIALRAKYQEDGDLQLPTDINLESEYLGMEHMIGVIRDNYNRGKNIRKANAAFAVANGTITKNDDDNGEAGQEPTYYDTSEDEAEHASDADMAAAHDTSEDEAQQASDADIGVAPSSTTKIPNDREIEESDLEEAAPAPPASLSKGKGSSSKAKGKGKDKATVSSTAASRQRSTKTPKGKGKGKGKAARSQSIVEDDEQSSDTDANEVEDIPAKTPNSKAKPKGKAKAARAEPVVEDEEQSSDTDADEVEDIPARRR